MLGKKSITAYNHVGWKNLWIISEQIFAQKEAEKYKSSIIKTEAIMIHQELV